VSIIAGLESLEEPPRDLAAGDGWNATAHQRAASGSQAIRLTE
jgi:hypothetical protein